MKSVMWIRVVSVMLVASGCGGESSDTAVELGSEPLALPEDPSEKGVPVGVKTEEWDGLTVEIWYPASDDTTGDTDSVNFVDWIPASVTALLGDVTVPLIETAAVRDASVRRAESPYPVVFFSHCCLLISRMFILCLTVLFQNLQPCKTY